MTTTKDQIQKLTPEQQEALGSTIIKRDTMRQRLLKQRGHYQAMALFPALVMVALYLAPMIFTNPKYGKLPIFCVGLSLWALIQFHAAGVNRRLDALIDLMEDDRAASNEDSSIKH